ncbi:hypothetical protein DIE18_12620 [Burkholderia sp. Bp9125]|nr:hypothetical protein DIE18_12620 [Burkholderia sp. Bp9125]
MIIKTIERFEALKEDDLARFWIAHLGEEAFHDRVMRQDLDRLFGSSADARAALQDWPISPPSAALVGYYEWQVLHGNPHLLAVLRLFLEWYFSTMSDNVAARVHSMIECGSRVLAIHRESDVDHVRPCFEYVERNCETIWPMVAWSLGFTADCLRESQLWAAKQVLRCA